MEMIILFLFSLPCSVAFPFFFSFSLFSLPKVVSQWDSQGARGRKGTTSQRASSAAMMERRARDMLLSQPQGDGEAAVGDVGSV